MLPPLPDIFLPSSQMPVLLSTARAALARRHPNAPFLMSELRRARVCAPADLPDDAIAMHDWASFRIDWDSPNRPCQLTYPADCRGDPKELSVMTRLGAAILGLRVNDRMPFLDEDGNFRLVTVAERLSFTTILPFDRRSVPSAQSQSPPQRDPHDHGPYAA